MKDNLFIVFLNQYTPQCPRKNIHELILFDRALKSWLKLGSKSNESHKNTLLKNDVYCQRYK